MNRGAVSEWSKVTDCKSVGSPTKVRILLAPPKRKRETMSHKPRLKLHKGGNGLGGPKGLNKKERLELIDLLRRNMIYQTPQPIFANEGDKEPSHVALRFVFLHQQRILVLLDKAGGWVMSPHEKKTVLKRHEESARVAHGDGDYDLKPLEYGALVAMHEELEGIEEMDDFRGAIEEEIGNRRS